MFYKAVSVAFLGFLVKLKRGVCACYYSLMLALSVVFYQSDVFLNVVKMVLKAVKCSQNNINNRKISVS
jgi:hypothetical protein